MAGSSKKARVARRAKEKAEAGNASFQIGALLNLLRMTLEKFPDKRTGSNAQYPMTDVGLAAFAVFFTQSPSFLAHQKSMQKLQGQNNAKTLFGIKNIPTDNRIRTLLDLVPPKYLFPIFWCLFEQLKEHGHLEAFRSVNGTLLVALDGTQYHSSKAVHCDNCSTKKHSNDTITYSHSAVTPVIVAPDSSVVFPLEPAFITPQDGAKKQDCEIAASKRWLEANAHRLEGMNITLLGDDLYCHQPFCKLVLSEGLGFIFVCKPDSHKTVYEWVSNQEKLGEVQTLRVVSGAGKREQVTTYRFVNHIPIREGDDALNINWCEVTITKKDAVTYKNAFATNHILTADNVVEICRAGRARWKIENENNNTLKTKGYHVEHNFGHGKKNLSALLCTMNILAFLFHTLLELGDETYAALREALPTRATFFEDVRALTRYVCFASWRALFTFMQQGLKERHQPCHAFVFD